jgi:hypothetical protein
MSEKLAKISIDREAYDWLVRAKGFLSMRDGRNYTISMVLAELIGHYTTEMDLNGNPMFQLVREKKS